MNRTETICIPPCIILPFLTV